MTRVLFLAVLAHVSVGAPLEGFGDATDAEIEEIRAGTYLEMFDENPTYNYNYKVADDTEQTYLSLEEARNDGVVTGMYSYVDPLGSLITVKYTAGAMGYTEERSEQPGFVSINPRPVSSSSSGSSGSLVADPAGSVGGGSAFSSSGSSGLSSSTSLSSGSSSLFSGSSSLSSGSSSQSSGTSSSSSSNSLDQSSLVAQIVSQIQPLVSQTVTSAVAGQSSNAGLSSTSATSLTSGQSSTSVSSDEDSLLILRPGSSSSSSSSSSSDLVAQILAQIGPLVSQTVSSVVSSGGSRTSTNQRASATLPPPAPATVSAIPLAVPTQSPRLIASGSQDKESLFGSSGDAFNVKINHAGANIEY